MKIFYDKNNVRFTLKLSGSSNINLLFIPGGPGCDSSIFDGLVSLLDNVKASIWYIDFPGNGSHDVQKDNFDTWLDIFIDSISGFDNPIIVGSSFGGMLPLLFPECEKILKGFIVLNSAPCLWLEAAVKFAKQHSLPDLTDDMQEFKENPNQQTFNKALAACTPYYFPSSTLEQGKKLLASVKMAFEPAVWWQHKAVEIKYDAVWIPQEIPTLIISAEFDAICPYELYDNDLRFKRDNIEIKYIEGAGHLPWIEQPLEVKSIFEDFIGKFY